MKRVRKIQMLIGALLSVLVVLIVASIFLFRSNGKKDSKPVSSTVSVKDSSSQAKSDKDTKVKEEEIHKLKDQLTDLDTKITEAEAIVSKLKEETAVPKLDIEALRNNDLSSLKGTWRTPSGKEFVINESSELYATGYRDGQKYESTYEITFSKGQGRRNSDTASFGLNPKGIPVGGGYMIAVPRGIVLESAGQYTDQSNTAEDRLVAGQSYPSMLTEPENVYYRLKPDTSKFEEEEKHLAQLQADREAIKTSLESKEKKNTN